MRGLFSKASILTLLLLTGGALRISAAAPIPTAGALLKGGKQEIGVGFNVPVKIATANVLANYSLSGGKLESVRTVNRPAKGFDASLSVQPYDGVVLVASGLTAGQSYTLTVKNVEDLSGNKIPAAGATATFKAEDKKTWTVVGANESKFSNDVIRHADGSFDVISGSVGFWADYDEATFVNEKVTGDFDAKAQLIEQDPSSQWARTGLMAREALDEGKVRPTRVDTGALVDGQYTIPKAQLFSRLQTVHANPAIRADAGHAENGWENHYRDETTYARTWDNQLQTANTGFSPLDYPNVWMRLKREGNTLNTFRSADGGQTWDAMTIREFTDLAADLYVGPFFAPELSNNPDASAGFPEGIKQLLGHSVLAKFRNYSIITAVKPGAGKFTGIKVQGVNVVIDFSGSGVQSASKIDGPWADVTGSSPLTVPVSGAPKFYRFKP